MLSSYGHTTWETDAQMLFKKSSRISARLREGAARGRERFGERCLVDHRGKPALTYITPLSFAAQSLQDRYTSVAISIWTGRQHQWRFQVHYPPACASSTFVADEPLHKDPGASPASRASECLRWKVHRSERVPAGDVIGCFPLTMADSENDPEPQPETTKPRITLSREPMLLLAIAATALAAVALAWLEPDGVVLLINELVQLGLFPGSLCSSSLRFAAALARQTRRFHLRKMNLASAEVQTALQQLGKLDAFLVEDCALGAEGFKQLEEVLRSCFELSFLRCPLGALPPGLTELAPRALRFRNCKLDADALSEMSTAVRAQPELSAVELLASLPGTGTEGEGPATSLVSRRMALNLLALDLSENHLAGAGRTMALLLRYCHQLAMLQLEDCALSLEDLTLLSRALARSRVERLDLAGNNLRREGLLVVARSLPSSHVQDLGLERNDIAMGDALSELKRAHDKRPFPGLRLQGNRLSSAEQTAFAASLQAAKLRLAGKFCPPGCKCFEGRGEVM
eukprot:s821_g6.t2